MRYRDLLRRLADNLRDERYRRGWSQEEMAHRSKVSLRALAALERADTQAPTLASVHAIAQALRVEVSDLLGPRPAGPRPEPLKVGRKLGSKRRT